MSGLVLSHVDKFYGPKGHGVHAVKDVSMTIAPGEIVALLGSSGCGKTSTLRMIAGFESVSKGTIELAGRRVDELAPARRNVAMAFEGYSLYPPLTVRDNIAFALKSARLAQAEIDKRVNHIAELLAIESILAKYPSSLSGGQQQRASLARALMRKADLYLLDEPMSQLEPQLRALLRGRVKNYLIEHDMTAMFVTHDQTEANALADRIAVMEGGVLQQIATPAELKDHPANLYVATFIGEPPMNVFEAQIADGRIVVAGRGGEAAFAVEAGAAMTRGLTRAHLGIRPHNVAVGRGAALAKVVSNQWLGDQTHVVLDAGGHQMVAVTYKRIPAAKGDIIAFEMAPQKIHLFDHASGRALLHGTERMA